MCDILPGRAGTSAPLLDLTVDLQAARAPTLAREEHQMHEQTFSRQYLRNVVSSLVHEGHDPFIKYAELKYVQRAFHATMASSACAGWLALNRAVESLEARAKARTH